MQRICFECCEEFTPKKDEAVCPDCLPKVLKRLDVSPSKKKRTVKKQKTKKRGDIMNLFLN